MIPTIRCSVLLLPCLLALPVSAAEFSVGVAADVSCSHTSLDAALDAAASAGTGPHRVKLAFTSLLYESGGDDDVLSLASPGGDIEVIGGYASCAAAQPGGGRTTLGLLPEQVGRILRVDGSATRRRITLRKLEIINGRSTSIALPTSHGGGIRASGAIDLVLDDVRVADNRAVRGGGVAVLDGATLELRNGSEVSSNTAESTSGVGGGIYCAGDGSVVRLRDAALLGNHAGGNGGAIFLDQCARLEAVREQVVGFTGINLQNNTAGDASGTSYGFGGAIYSRRTRIDLAHESFATHRTWFLNNTGHHGGAIYLEGTTGVTLLVDIDNAAFVSNTARAKGGALYARDQVDVRIGHGKSQPCPFSANLAGDMVTLDGCSLMLDNRSLNQGSTTSSGGAVAYLSQSTELDAPPLLVIQRSTLRSNADAGQAALVYAQSGSVRIDSSILVDNTAAGDVGLSPSLLRLFAPGPHALQHSTVVGNAVTRVARVQASEWDVTGSILHSPTTRAWLQASGGAIRHRGCLLTHPLDDSVPDEEVAPGFFTAGTIQTDPQLGPDFRPGPGSRAIDGCGDGLLMLPVDHAGAARGFDVPGVLNYPWPTQVGGIFSNDLGALELRSAALFRDGFESP